MAARQPSFQLPLPRRFPSYPIWNVPFLVRRVTCMYPHQKASFYASWPRPRASRGKTLARSTGASFFCSLCDAELRTTGTTRLHGFHEDTFRATMRYLQRVVSFRETCDAAVLDSCRHGVSLHSVCAPSKLRTSVSVARPISVLIFIGTGRHFEAGRRT